MRPQVVRKAMSACGGGGRRGFPDCFLMSRVHDYGYEFSRSSCWFGSVSQRPQGVSEDFLRGKGNPVQPKENNSDREEKQHDEHRSHASADNDDGVRSFVAEKARGGSRKAVETAFHVGEAVAQGMEESWGAIRETTQKIRDTVLGDDKKSKDDTNNKKSRNR